MGLVVGVQMNWAASPQGPKNRHSMSSRGLSTRTRGLEVVEECVEGVEVDVVGAALEVVSSADDEAEPVEEPEAAVERGGDTEGIGWTGKNCPQGSRLTTRKKDFYKKSSTRGCPARPLSSGYGEVAPLLMPLGPLVIRADLGKVVSSVPPVMCGSPRSLAGCPHCALWFPLLSVDNSTAVAYSASRRSTSAHVPPLKRGQLRRLAFLD